MTGAQIAILAVAFLIIITMFKAIRVVPQSQKFVVERFGAAAHGAGAGDQLYRAVRGPGGA